MAKKSGSTRGKATRQTKKSGAKKSGAKKSGAKKTGAKKTAITPKQKKTSASTRSSTGAKTTSKKYPTGKKKAAGKKSASKKPAAKKRPVKKTASKKTAQKTAKTGAPKKASAKQAPGAKKPAKGATSKASSSQQAPAKSAEQPAKPGTSAQNDASRGGRKGITVVSQKHGRRAKSETPKNQCPPTGERLLGPGSPVRRPLIPSGPSAPPAAAAQTQAPGPNDKVKSPFNKRQLEKFKRILREKRADLIGDVSQIESGALMSESGGLSHLPQHIAEQGSDNYDQSLSLDLAAADRKLIREIDAALARIEAGTYGVCELTRQPIRAERLEELPWARYSIEAAREIERRSGTS